MPNAPPKFCSTDTQPTSTVSLPRISSSLRPMLHVVRAKHGPHEIEAEEADAPQADDAGYGQRQADEGVASASAGSPNSSRQRTGFVLALAPFGNGMLPALGLFEPCHG